MVKITGQIDGQNEKAQGKSRREDRLAYIMYRSCTFWVRADFGLGSGVPKIDFFLLPSKV